MDSAEESHVDFLGLPYLPGSFLEPLWSVALVVAAVAMASAFTLRQVFPKHILLSARPGAQPSEPEFYAGWMRWMAVGTPLEADSAPVSIIEFTDLKCPFCERFHETVLNSTKEKYGSAIAVFLIHLPLRMHRFAEISAVAAECARDQGKFAEFVDVLFQEQDSIGLKTWASYALDAGIPETREHQSCVEYQMPLERVRAGRALADSLGITATPTIFVNGWRLPKPPGEAELSSIIRNILDGRGDPFSSQE